MHPSSLIHSQRLLYTTQQTAPSSDTAPTTLTSPTTMQAFKSRVPDVFVPLDPPVGLLADWVADKPTFLKVAEETLPTGGAVYNVTDTNGDIVLKGERRALSLHKELNHVKLITLRSSLSFTGKTTGVVGLDSSGAIVLDVHMDSGTHALGVHYTGFATHQPATLRLQGQLVNNTADIVLNNTYTVARVRREVLSTSEESDQKKTYFIWVAQGVDVAFTVATCIALGRLLREQTKAK
ncbi:uncharacterized protein LOC62_01G000070 [Vanrija pseudolonga]|uniref:Tubby C-terminal domain-containing protein n=1 Tax=Vanrija pseudolonga TaxID=143232 RepID=A0AAF0Y205_9TREE|nr:hypothetical protein LOC62_01G000070 [Vanrija pseudolonga]